MAILITEDNKFCDRAAKVGALHSKLGFELYKKYVKSGLTNKSYKDYLLNEDMYKTIIKENTYENESERG